MAYYLASDGTNDYVQLQSYINIGVNENYAIELDIECSDNDSFGVRLFGVSGSDTSRFIIFDGLSANAVFSLFGTQNVGLPVDVLDRHTWTLFREDTVTNGLRVDGVLSPASGSNGAGLSFNWLLTQRSDTNARNAVNLYRMKIWKEGILVHDWNPSNRSLGDNILVDEVGGNHGTLVNFATDGSQWVYYDDGSSGEAIEHLTDMALVLIAGDAYSSKVKDAIAFSSQLDTKIDSSNTSTVRDRVSNAVSKQVLAYQQAAQKIVDAYADTITYTLQAEPSLNAMVLDRSASLVSASTLGPGVFSSQVRDVLLQDFSENTRVLTSFIQPTQGSIHTTLIIESVRAGGVLPTLIHDTYSGVVYENIDAVLNVISLVKDFTSSTCNEIAISYSTNTSEIRDASSGTYSTEVTAIDSEAIVEIKDYLGSAFVLDTNTQAVTSTLVLDEVGGLVGITTQAIFTEYFFTERPKLRLQPQDLFTQVNVRTNINPSINITTPLNKLILGASRL